MHLNQLRGAVAAYGGSVEVQGVEQVGRMGCGGGGASVVVLLLLGAWQRSRGRLPKIVCARPQPAVHRSRRTPHHQCTTPDLMTTTR